jgi:adenosylhomocysteine nucleosidase
VRFDAIVVPRGAEARAVEQGWPAARSALLAVPAGAAAGTRLADAAFGATALVLGVCGALDPGLRVGDTVVYARIADGADLIELDAELTAVCAAACATAPVGAANVAGVVGAPSAKAALRVATGAAVIDMEAASIARALHGRGVRVAMVRVVSDDAAGELPDLRDVYTPGGALRPLALALAFARTPRRSALFIVHALVALRALRATAARLASCSTDV